MLNKFLTLSLITGCSFFGLAAEENEAKIQIFTGTVSEELLKEFEFYAEEAMAAWQVPGMAIGIVKNNQTILSKGFGVKELGESGKINSDTLFQIGSITKSFTSALVAIMVDEETLSWEEPVINRLPDFVLFDPWVTKAFQIQDLLAQRSGLAPHVGDSQVYFGASRLEMIKHLRYIKPITSFRSAFAYQNSLFLVAGEILGSITGLSWEKMIKERLLNPLEMKNSNTGLKDFLSYKNASQLHKRVDGQTKIIPKDFPFLDTYSIFGPAGGINSTVNDMNQWLKFQLNKGVFNDAPLISKANLERTYRRYIFAEKLFDADNYYGLGWCVRDYSPYPIIWHDGATSGFSSMLAFIPQENLGIVILTNCANNNLSKALTMQFFDLYYQKVSKDWSQELLEDQIILERQKREKNVRPKDPEAPLPLEKYVGIFSNELYGRVEVTVQEDKLQMILGSKKMPLFLEHWNHDSFELLWPALALEADEKLLLNFIVGSEGEANQLSIPFLENGLNIFNKL